MSTSYLTVARPASVEIEVKRSRFLCTIERVAGEESARAVIDRLRKEHWDARHTCSAFILGPDGSLQRSNDDGEPAGTAGAPMLEVLRGGEVFDVVAVVTRWFGGVLLGAGGLVRAYSDAVRAGLDSAGTLRRELVIEYLIEVSHAEAGRLETELRMRGVIMLDVTYGSTVSLLLGVRAGAAFDLTALLAELTSGSSIPAEAGSRWVDLPQS